MKKTIKYLDNDGNYQYATVKDAGDLDQLKTKSKTDLVAAINELATEGVAVNSNYNDLKEVVNGLSETVSGNATDAQNNLNQVDQEIKKKIAEMVEDFKKADKQINDAMEKDKAELIKQSQDAKSEADAQMTELKEAQKTNAQNLEIKASVIQSSLDATKEDLDATEDRLNNTEIQAGVVQVNADKFADHLETKVSSTDYNALHTRVEQAETSIKQTNKMIETKATLDYVDKATGAVVKQGLEKIDSAQGETLRVAKEAAYKEVDKFTGARMNRLRWTRNFNDNSNDTGHWELNGNLKVDDDHAYDTAHDVLGVSVKNGTTVDQVTDLGFDDVAKAWVLSFWVKQGKVPRAWYGTQEFPAFTTLKTSNGYDRVSSILFPEKQAQTLRIGGTTDNQDLLVISEPKLEQVDKAERASDWSTNPNDEYAKTEKLEHQLVNTNDRLQSTITTQRDYGKKITQNETRITQTESDIQTVAESVKTTESGLREDYKSKINQSAQKLTTEYEAYTNKTVGDFEGVDNLILNSGFTYVNDSKAKWTSVDSHVKIETDSNGTKWAHMSQSGLKQRSPIGLESNIFAVDKGTLAVGVDLKSNNAKGIDDTKILVLQMYNSTKQRVASQELSLEDLGLSTNALNDGRIHRGKYKFALTRDDTRYMSVYGMLPKNGDIYMTNFSAKNSSLATGAYTPSTKDADEQFVYQNSQFTQTAKGFESKVDALSTTVKNNKDEADKKYTDVTNRTTTLEQTADGFKTSIGKLTQSVDGIDVGSGTNYMREDSVKPYNTNSWSKNADADGFSWGMWVPNGDNTWGYGVDFAGGQIKVPYGSAYTDSVEVWTDTPGLKYRVDVNNEPLDAAKCSSNDNDDTARRVMKPGLNDNIPTGRWVKLISTAWNTNSANTTHADLHDFSKLGVLNTTGKTVFVKFRHAKQELGSTATDWVKAQADIDNKILSIEKSTNDVTSTADGIKAELTKIKTNDSSSELSKAIVKLASDGLSTKFSKIEGSIGDVNGKADKLGDKINDIKNGAGANLVRNSSNQKDLSYWTASGKYNKAEPVTHSLFHNGQRRLLHLSTTKNKECYLYTDYMEIEQNADYTLSFQVFGNVNGIGWDVHVLGDNGDAGVKPPAWKSLVWETGNNANNKSAADKKVYHFHTNNVDKRICIRFDNNGSKDGQDAGTWFGDIKLEKGNEATAWTPSPLESTDLVSGVIDKQASFEATIKGVQSTVSDYDGNKKKWSEFIQNAETFQSTVGKKVDGIQADATAVAVAMDQNMNTNIADDQTQNREIVANSSAYNFMTYRLNQTLDKGTWITVSAVIASTAGSTPRKAAVTLQNEATNAEVAKGYIPIDGSRHSVTLYASNDQSNKVLIYSSEIGATQNCGVKIHDVLIEKGKYDEGTSTYKAGDTTKTEPNGTNVHTWVPTMAEMIRSKGDTERNLLGGTSPNWRNCYGITSDNIWFFVSSSSNGRDIDMSQVTTGTKFIYSVDVKNTSKANFYAEYYWRDGKGKRLTPAGASPGCGPGKDTRIELQVRAKPAEAVTLEIGLVVESDASFASQAIQIKNEMLEEGSMTHAWTASSLDHSENLISGTSDFSGDKWTDHLKSSNAIETKTTWIGGKTPDGNKTAYNLGSWNGPRQAIKVPRGTYTFSCYLYQEAFRGDGKAHVYFTQAEDSSNAKVWPDNVVLPWQPDKWVKVVIPIEVGGIGNLYPRMESDNGVRIHFGSYKLERGLVKNPVWTENPGNIMSRISQTASSISLAVGNLNDYKSDADKRIKSAQDTANSAQGTANSAKNGLEGNNLVSLINMDSTHIRLKSRNINIDGATNISGTLKVPNVKLAGNNNNFIDLTGNNIVLKHTSGGENGAIQSIMSLSPLGTIFNANQNGKTSDITINPYGIYMTSPDKAMLSITGKQITISSPGSYNYTQYDDSGITFATTYNNSREILGGLYTGHMANHENLNGIHINVQSRQKLGNLYGGDVITLGSVTRIADGGRTWDADVGMTYDGSGAVLGEQKFQFYKTVSFVGHELQVMGTSLKEDNLNWAPYFGNTSWSTWTNADGSWTQHWSLRGGGGGYAMSGDGTPILFGRGKIWVIDSDGAHLK